MGAVPAYILHASQPTSTPAKNALSTRATSLGWKLAVTGAGLGGRDSRVCPKGRGDALGSLAGKSEGTTTATCAGGSLTNCIAGLASVPWGGADECMGPADGMAAATGAEGRALWRARAGAP